MESLACNNWPRDRSRVVVFVSAIILNGEIAEICADIENGLNRRKGFLRIVIAIFCKVSRA